MAPWLTGALTQGVGSGLASGISGVISGLFGGRNRRDQFAQAGLYGGAPSYSQYMQAKMALDAQKGQQLSYAQYATSNREFMREQSNQSFQQQLALMERQAQLNDRSESRRFGYNLALAGAQSQWNLSNMLRQIAQEAAVLRQPNFVERIIGPYSSGDINQPGVGVLQDARDYLRSFNVLPFGE